MEMFCIKCDFVILFVVEILVFLVSSQEAPVLFYF